MTAFFTADTHFGHEAIIRLCDRPYASVAEMDESLVANWNAVVGAKDDVWHLGDFGLALSRPRAEVLFGRLNGRKRLVIGNHDKQSVLHLPWMEPPAHRLMPKLPGVGRVVLDHYAGRTWLNANRGSVQLFGHSHGRMPGNRQQLDVGVDCWDYRPAAWEEIQARLKALPEFGPADRRSVGVEDEE